MRKTEGRCDLTLVVDSRSVGVQAALQHLADSANITFQTGFGEIHPESEKARVGRVGLSMDVRYNSRTERLSGSYDSGLPTPDFTSAVAVRLRPLPH